MDRIIVLKLISGEEIVATFIEESEYEVSVMFPMMVKYMPKITEGRVVEAITLAPYSHFASDDIFTFVKSHIMFCKELNNNYYNVYALAVEDFIQAYNPPSDPQTVEELKETVDKLKEIFGENFDQKEYDEWYDEPPTKAIH